MKLRYMKEKKIRNENRNEDTKEMNTINYYSTDKQNRIWNINGMGIN